ncbi:MAG: DsrE family protein [Pseudomonadota bacterium]|nr:DsrE family protein [Pseudomonadota bacterium]
MASPDKLSLIVQSSDFDRVHYALVIASAALATGKPVTLFFTMEGIRALTLNFVDAKAEAALKQKQLATFEELLAVCAEMGASFMFCEMGLRVSQVKREQFRSDIEVREGSVVSFIADASSSGAMLYI